MKDSPAPDITGPAGKEHAPQKKSTLGKKIVYIIIAFALLNAVFTTQPHYVISGDRINIHMYGPMFSAAYRHFTGGYEMRFDDIANIELLPYSARQLGRMIEDLYVPALTTGRGGRMTIGRYSGRYRLHVRLEEEASPTVWITRRTAVPVLLSFRESILTEGLYRHLTAAWRRYQAN